MATILLVILLIISGLQPYDRTTWFLEIFPLLFAWPIMWATYRRFPLTTLLYASIFIHSLILISGGAFSYARVPLGFEIAEFLNISRNPYDKIGHFFQGFVPALIAREILIRGKHLSGKKLRAFIVLCIVLAISASYELIEWAAAMILGQGADEFLGTQGDPWDTQSDMLFALVGGIFALLVFSRVHDRQIDRISSE